MLRVRILVATLWAGSLWTIGYLVAPVLFSTLADRVLAGTIAGQLFRIEAWVSVTCAAVLIASLIFGNTNSRPMQQHRLLFIILAMLFCTLAGYFGLQPFMAELREAAGPGGVMDSDLRAKFGMLHAASSALYLVQSLFGIALVLKVR
jgi:hypothetical protein